MLVIDLADSLDRPFSHGPSDWKYDLKREWTLDGDKTPAALATTRGNARLDHVAGPRVAYSREGTSVFTAAKRETGFGVTWTARVHKSAVVV